MKRTLAIGVVMALALVSVATMPALGAPTQQVDECKNADNGPGENGPPGFVADLVPDVVSSTIGELPVPNFVKSFFGAETC